ncbi:T9SS type A sorting domain-containing protein [bacterium]|nr:T9SS type A sorting domain-containing protein [bacterium]
MHFDYRITALAILLLCISSLPLTSKAQIELSGVQAGLLDPGDYLVVDDIIVPIGATWTLSAGTNIFLLEEMRIFVNGSLICQGTEQDSIIIDAYDHEQRWDKILVDSFSDSCIVMNYCRVSHSNDFGIHIIGNNGFFYNSTISEINGTGIRSNYPIIVDNCIFTRCESSAIKFQGIYHASVSNSTFINTDAGISASSIDLDHCYFSNVGRCLSIDIFSINSSTVDSCYFEHNNSIYGVIDNNADSTIYVENSIFYSNTSKLIASVGPVHLATSTFTENSAASPAFSTVYDYDFYATNIILNDNDYTMLLEQEDQNTVNIIYSDIYNTTLNMTYPDTSLGVPYYTNLNGDSVDIYFNITSDPLFDTNADTLFQLTNLSPCIDAGNPDQPNNQDGTISDIGAIQYSYLSINESVTNNMNRDTDNIKIFPNPTNSTLVVLNDNYYESRYHIYNIMGRHIAEGLLGRGVNTITLNNMNSGTYFIRFEHYPDNSTKFILLK